MQDRFQQQFNQQYQGHSQTKEGEVTIEKNKSTPKKNTNDLGEYVEFEEVNE
tara:strand:+ start:1145 stop:1300 length:156 start_codon:yes stop_codon:yes gene_type:complete